MSDRQPESCQWCHYWEPRKSSPGGSERHHRKNLDQATFQCRRHSPVHSPAPPHVGTALLCSTSWPYTFADFWCGDFKEIQ